MAEPETFGLLLRRYRLAASLSQEALGERACLSANAIAALERGRRAGPRGRPPYFFWPTVWTWHQPNANHSSAPLLRP